MSGLLNIATSALLANQSALQTTGNNIANANTTGYSRQTSVLQTVPGTYTGSGYIGGGVAVSEVKRNYSEFLTKQVANTTSAAAMDSSRLQYLQQLENVFPTGDASVGTAVNNLLNSFSDVAVTPSDLSAKSLVVAQGDELATRLQSSASQLDDLATGARQEISASVTAINSLAQRIAALNQQIARTQGSGQTPNDQLDARDQLLQELSGYVKISTVADDSNGTLNVYVANQPLVLGVTASTMAMSSNEYGDASQIQLTVQQGNVKSVIDENNLTGGSVAGLLRFNNVDLVDARNTLGRLAVAVTSTVNDQHRLGLTASGAAGGDFFVPQTLPTALSSSTNTGTASIDATVADATALKASNYQITVQADGSTLAVTRMTDGVTTNFTGSPLQIDGLTISVDSGSLAAGDHFLLKPFADGAATMQTAINSGNDLATSSPVQATAGASNAGTLAIQSISASTASANLTSDATLTFNGNGTFDITSNGTTTSGLSYAAGTPISFNGWTLTLQGIPKAGDTISVGATPAGYVSSDAGNAKALMALRDTPMFDGVSLSDAYADVLSQVGVLVQGAKSTAQVSASTATAAATSKASLSGVNLDEEASKLLQFQQAYQASAKIIQIANSVFDTLLQNVG